MLYITKRKVRALGFSLPTTAQLSLGSKPGPAVVPTRVPGLAFLIDRVQQGPMYS